jgi:hypothetical protein
LNFFHPGVVQLSGVVAGATWGVTHAIHSQNLTASLCQWRKHQLDRSELEAFRPTVEKRSRLWRNRSTNVSISRSIG